MSATERAFDTIKAVFTYRDQMAELRADMAEQGQSIRRLAASHAHLRERVNQIEGYLKGATGQPFSTSNLPQLEQ